MGKTMYVQLRDSIFEWYKEDGVYVMDRRSVSGGPVTRLDATTTAQILRGANVIK